MNGNRRRRRALDPVRRRERGPFPITEDPMADDAKERKDDTPERKREDAEQKAENRKDKLDERLDEGLEETFPSSDPVAVKVTK